MQTQYRSHYQPSAFLYVLYFLLDCGLNYIMTLLFNKSEAILMCITVFIYMDVQLYWCLPPFIASRLAIVSSQEVVKHTFFSWPQNSCLSSIFKIQHEELHDLHIFTH